MDVLSTGGVWAGQGRQLPSLVCSISWDQMGEINVINRKREGADVPVWTVELGRVCSYLHQVSAPGFFHALCTRLPNLCVWFFWAFPHSFFLHPLGQLISSLSNIPGRQSCVCSHCFARASPVWWCLPWTDGEIRGRQKQLPVVPSGRCAQRDEQVSAVWSKAWELLVPQPLTWFQCTFWETGVSIAAGVHCQR